MVPEVQDSILYVRHIFLDSNKGVKGEPFTKAVLLLRLFLITDFLTLVH